MSEELRVQTSPLFFVHPRVGDASAVELGGRGNFSSLSRTAARLLMAALEPIGADALREQGFDARILDAALAEGLLIRCDDPRLARASAWEDKGWSRAAYLLYTQMDLTYAEEAHAPVTLDETVDTRRRILSDYLDLSSYPPHYLIESEEVIALPRVEDERPANWNALFARRSVRGFLRRPVPLETMAAILWRATANARIGEESKQKGDHFFLLNSFYTWLVILVAVQDVDGVSRGLYQYDPLRHELRAVGRDATDAEIAAVIQNQKWIGGSGFCVFVAAHWERYMWLYRHSRAYINLLIQVGEFGQELLREAIALGLGGWMTPAVDEDGAQALFGLPDARIDILYFQKIGPPRPIPTDG